ncbi:MAG: ATP-binding protein [Lachnospiraceae bacterium]|jgi:predicted AAA+ superfamily ATPase|nr:ATP-binding protein [Lachnospiraceae bacterium]
MERFAMNQLLKWKDKENRKPLIIRGARQVGKTWLMKEFGKRYFEKVAYISFINNERMKQIFEGDVDIDRLILGLSAESGVDIEASNTLIIMDEIQEVPKALASLKYFYEDAPEYQIVSAGSLLGVALHKGTSFPVGKVDFMDLYPLSFQEFLFAIGDERYIKILNGNDEVMIKSFKSKYIERLREYYFVGGMPEVVQSFINNNNYKAAREIQNNILNYYQQDFSKHAENTLFPRLNLIWNSIPSQLAKENKKFIYGQVRKGARAKEFELAIQWLLDCGLIHKVHRIKKPNLPLKAYMEMDVFKIYLLDVGLLGAMVDLDEKVILEGNQLFTEFKGALTEQYVLQQLIADLDTEPYYYSSPNSTGEIDFILQGRTNIIPVEVKAEENLKARSLRMFVEKFKSKYALRISMSDYREQDWMTNIPLYEIRKVEKYLEE